MTVEETPSVPEFDVQVHLNGFQYAAQILFGLAGQASDQLLQGQAYRAAVGIATGGGGP